MKIFYTLCVLFFCSVVHGQITNPLIRAGFGIDADLRANYFNSSVVSGNDDWFWNGNPGTGNFVIDTTGAYAINAGYASDVSPFPGRMQSFFRTMARPQFSVVNNRLWLDALFIRDYHGIDTTVFTAGSDKNGMSPVNWSGGIQGIPDKNDIPDMFMHVRRDGPATTDSLWFFGGLSLAGTTGNRYFDFEMYQTDIYYDRASSKWYGYGPDAGHTKWEFDAMGNILRPGDIIFSAEYQSSSLTKIEARIWVDKASLAITPTTFNWSGQFDGASSGSQYGYASILPKTGGTFYTGLQSGNGEWAGPFSLVLQDNSVVSNYSARQFMEFSVNLTKLGLDPVTVFGSDICGTPFNRVVVKTRASASFTAELKDFVAPIDLFLAPRVDAITDVPLYCGSVGASTIHVQNPSTASVYTWYTPNGNIVGTNTGPVIQVNAPGTYIVQQQLAAGCSPYAYDTVTIVFDATCVPMDQSVTSFNGVLKNKKAYLSWSTMANDETAYFELERSLDGKVFSHVNRISSHLSENPSVTYQYADPVEGLKGAFVHYRLKIRALNGSISYSKTIRLALVDRGSELLLFPNPATDKVQMALFVSGKESVTVKVHDMSGRLLESRKFAAMPGANQFALETHTWKNGTYLIQVYTAEQVLHSKLLVNRQGTAP